MNRMVGDGTEQRLKKLSEDWIVTELRGDTAFIERTLEECVGWHEASMFQFQCAAPSTVHAVTQLVR